MSISLCHSERRPQSHAERGESILLLKRLWHTDLDSSSRSHIPQSSSTITTAQVPHSPITNLTCEGQSILTTSLLNPAAPLHRPENMGCGSSKLKGDEITDLSSPPPPHPSKSNRSSTTSSSAPQPINTTTSTTTTTTDSHLPSNQDPTNNGFQSTYTHTLSPQKEQKQPPKKQSLSQRWRERKGVPEPKDENGRGLYTGMTTDELVKMGGSQVVDGRVYEAGSAG